MLQEDIKFYVLNGKFEEIKNIMSNIDFMEFEEVYISCAHEQRKHYVLYLYIRYDEG